MKKKKKYIALVVTLLLVFNFTGCDALNLGTRNEYFEYLNTGKIEKISIQSVRDPGFKFIVTESKAIDDIYQLLSKAKVSESKAELNPDYVFEIKMGDEVKKFNYVVGAYDGNFYDESMSFTVSKRLDEGIIQNLSFIRKPRDFEYIYYNSILEVLNMTKGELKNGEYKVGIDIQGDIDCLKYVFSTDVEDFLKKARKITPNVELVDNNSNEFDVVFTIKNRGYDSTTYKTNISVDNKRDKIQRYYYVLGINEFKEWNIEVFDDDTIPQAVKQNW
ncbi:MAG: hypothetical protein ACRDA3_07425 [Peptostreptococcaceae bacterium]